MRLDRDVAPGVHRIEDAKVNWYLIEEDDAVTVVDAGVPASWTSLRDALSALGRTFGELRALILTHAHFDHVGFARRAQEELSLPVLCPAGDEEIARHPLSYPHERSRLPYFAHPGGVAVISQLAAKGAFFVKGVQDLEVFRPGVELDVPGRPKVLATPGHTPGHVSFHLPDRDVVLVGDTIVMLDPYTGRTGPRLVARAATADVAQNTTSLETVAATGAKVVLTGHGDPWTQGAGLAAERARAAGSA